MFQIIPSIDLRAGKIVRLQQGDYARQLNYDLDPADTLAAFHRAGATWAHIVDLDGAKQGSPAQLELIGKLISGSPLKIQVGGGVRTTEDIQQLLAAGARRVAVGTKALEDWDWFETLVNQTAFENKLVLALDAKDGVVAKAAWTESTGLRAVDIAARVGGWPLAGILYTDVARDGLLGGPNVEQTLALARAGSVPVIASGGVGSLEHIRPLLTGELAGVILGRSLHEERVDLHAAIELARSV